MPPSLKAICKLSLIYGRSFPSLFEGTLAEVKPLVLKRLQSLPPRKKGGLKAFNRHLTLTRLQRQLTAQPPAYGGA